MLTAYFVPVIRVEYGSEIRNLLSVRSSFNSILLIAVSFKGCVHFVYFFLLLLVKPINEKLKNYFNL